MSFPCNYPSGKGFVQQPLEIRIIIPRDAGVDPPALELWNTFHVLVTNISKTSIRLYSDKTEWGYYALSFEIEAKDGRNWKPTKLTRGWDSNYPIPLELLPQESIILTVSFKEKKKKLWDGVPEFNPSKEKAIWEINGNESVSDEAINVKMRAVYQCNTDEYKSLNSSQDSNKMWSGIVKSEWQYFIMWE